MAEGGPGLATGVGPHDRPVERVRDWLHGSGGGAVLVEGGIGAGKSRALRRATATAVAGGAAVAVRRATELDHLAPLTTLTMTLRGESAVAGAAARLDPSPDRRLALVDDLTAKIAEAARRRPLLVGVDDVDRGDALSLLIMRLLMAGLADERVLWVSTARSGAVPSIQELDLERIRLGTLDPEGVARLISEELGAPPDPDLAARCAAAEGDPFVLVAVCRAMLAARSVHVVDGHAVAADGADAVHGGDRPSSRRSGGAWDATREPFSARSARVPPSATRSACTPSPTCSACRRATSRRRSASPCGTACWWRTAIASRSAARSWPRPSTRISTSPPARPGTAPPRRPSATTGARPGGWPTTSSAAGREAGPGLPGCCATSHDRARSVDPVVAAATARHAVHLTDPDDPGLSDTVVEAVSLLVAAGQVREARGIAERHLRPGLPAEDEAAVVSALVPVLIAAGEPWTLVEHVRRTSQRPDLPPERHAELTGLLAYASVLAGDLGEAPTHVAEAMVAGEAPAAPTAAAWATSASAMLRLVAGEVEHGVADARRAVAATDRAGRRMVHHRPRMVLGLALTLAGRLDEAEAVSLVAEREMDGSGHIGRPWAWARRAVHAWLRDRPDETAEAARTGVAACADEAEPRVSLLVLWSLAELRRGDTDAARAPLARARERWGRRGRAEHPRLLLAELVLSLETGARPASLVTSARAAVAALGAHPGLLLGLPDAAERLLRIARDAGDSGLEGDVLAHADGLVAANPGLPAFALWAASLRTEPMRPPTAEPRSRP